LPGQTGLIKAEWNGDEILNVRQAVHELRDDLFAQWQAKNEAMRKQVGQMGMLEHLTLSGGRPETD
jgi:hypothetical protein